MTEQDAAYMASALADGQHMTEAGAEALVAGSTLFDHGPAWVRDDDEIADYIETLEQEVLKSWDQVLDSSEGYGDHECAHCDGAAQRQDRIEHAPGCIVPALIAKYEESG